MTQASPVYYAIGDIHGESERLADLHESIFAFHAFTHTDAPMCLVHLGDYIDRGPDSYAVVERLRELEADASTQTINLRGNHEQWAIDSLRGPDPDSEFRSWMKWGGRETLDSYERRGHETVTDAHLDWMEGLASIHTDPDARLIFVHAGVDPDTYPDDREGVYLWTRAKRFFKAEKWDNPALEGWCVVHGHTPTVDDEPEQVAGRRINVDTGAVFGGKLTAVCLAPGSRPTFLHA